MNAAMAPMSTTEATSQAWLEGMAFPPAGAAARKNPPRPATMTTAPSHSMPGQPVAEPATEDEQQEEQFGGEHGLDHAQLPEAQGGGLQAELHEHEGEADEPDPPLDGVGHQAQRRVVDSGAVSTPMRWRTEVRALTKAASRCQEVGHRYRCTRKSPAPCTPPGRVYGR